MKALQTVLISALALPAQADEAFEQKVIAAIMENPEVIVLALQSLEERREAELEEANKEIITQTEDALFGPDPAIQLVEFFDYRCGYCARAAQEHAQLPDDVKKTIKWIELPILGDVSRDLAKVSLAVRNVEGTQAYATFRHAVFDSQGRVSSTALALQITKQFGWDHAAISTEARSDTVARELRDNELLAQLLDVRGTPTYVSRDQVHRGMLSNEQIIEIAERAQHPTSQSE